MCQSVQWTSYMSALSVPLFAACAALIAYRQWKTARDKLKLDLFDRRMALYQAASAELVRAWGGWEDMDTGDAVADNLKLAEAKWLTSSEVASYLQQPFRKRLEELADFAVILEGHDIDSPDYDSVGHDARLAERTAIYERIVEKLDELFYPFLTLNH